MIVLLNDSAWANGYLRYIAIDDANTGVLSGDTTAPGVSSWHVVSMTAYGGKLRMYVDGSLVTEVEDTSHTIGRFGLISAYNQPNAEYDYLLARKYVEPEPLASVSSTVESRPSQETVFVIYVRNQGGVEVTITDVYVKAPSGIEDHLSREELSFTGDGCFAQANLRA